MKRRVIGACALLLGGCSTAEERGVEPAAEYLGLRTPEAGAGVQLRSTGLTVGAGEDVEYCEVLEIPGEPGRPYHVSTVEVGNGPGSHHLLIDSARPGEPAEPNVAASPLGEPAECLGATQLFGDGFENIAVSQQPYYREELPAGIARVVYGGQRVVFDYHYYNTTDGPLQAQSAANLYFVPEAEVEHEARVFAFNNSMIDTPPLSKKSFLGECHFKDDVTLASLQRHTHQWGRDFVAWYAGGPNDGQQIFTSPDYNHDVRYVFPEPVAVKKGDGFRFRCDFDNTENRPLRFGVNATDEMCFLFGIWWGGSDDTPSQDCAMTAIDPEGIARPPSDVGFPEPTAAENAACVDLSVSAPRPLEDDCAKCYCDSCAVPINACAADAECKALLDCAIETRCGYDTCIAACPEAFNAHSSGIGLLVPVGQCLLGPCSHCTE